MSVHAAMPAALDQDLPLDNTNHDLVHSLSVRLDAQWHDRSYEAETRCPGCHAVFERLRAMDREAVQLLSRELQAHIASHRFPLDVSD